MKKYNGGGEYAKRLKRFATDFDLPYWIAEEMIRDESSYRRCGSLELLKDIEDDVMEWVNGDKVKTREDVIKEILEWYHNDHYDLFEVISIPREAEEFAATMRDLHVYPYDPDGNEEK